MKTLSKLLKFIGDRCQQAADRITDDGGPARLYGLGVAVGVPWIALTKPGSITAQILAATHGAALIVLPIYLLVAVIVIADFLWFLFHKETPRIPRLYVRISTLAYGGLTMTTLAFTGSVMNFFHGFWEPIVVMYSLWSLSAFCVCMSIVKSYRSQHLS